MRARDVSNGTRQTSMSERAFIRWRPELPRKNVSAKRDVLQSRSAIRRWWASRVARSLERPRTIHVLMNPP